MPETVNQNIADAATTHAVAILRVEAQMRQDVLNELKRLEGTIVGDIAALPEDATDFRRGRLDALLQQTRDSIEATYATIAENNNASLADIASHTQDKTEQIVNRAVQVDVMTVATTPKQFESIVSNIMIAGRTQEEWWGKQSQELKDNFTAQMRDGLARGEGIDQLVRRVRGTKENGFSDGIMNVRRNQAEALVRTSVQSVANDARLRSYQENTDVIKAIQWLSTLDGRTTAICIALHGKQWSLPDYEPIDHDIEFPGPTAHWNCRSTQIPVTRDWNELSQSGAVNPPDGEPDDLPHLLEEKLDDAGMSEAQIAAALDEQRVAFDGNAVQPESFESFLVRKGEDFQNALLGIQKAAMWRNGDITLTDLVNEQARPLSTDALKQLVADNIEIPYTAAKEGENGLGIMERSLLEDSMSAGRDNNAVLTHFLDNSTGEHITITGYSPTPQQLSKIEAMKNLTVLRNARHNGEAFTPQEINLFGRLKNFKAAKLVSPNGKVVTLAERNGRVFTLNDAKAINTAMAKSKVAIPNATDRLMSATAQNGSAIVRRTPVGAVQPPAAPAPKPATGYGTIADAIKGVNTKDVRALATAIEKNAKPADAVIQPVMRGISERSGGTLEGTEFSTKEVDSLEKKIRNDAAENGWSFEKAALEVKDSVRYTIQFSDEHYVEGVNAAMADLRTQGYEIERVRNNWGSAYYQGINTVLRSPAGLRVELQFHTHESLLVKETESHEIYKLLDDAIDPAERAKLKAQLFDVWKKVPSPQGSTGIVAPGEKLTTDAEIKAEDIMHFRGSVDSSKLEPLADRFAEAFTRPAGARDISLSHIISTKNELRDAKYVAGTKGDPRQKATDAMVRAITKGGEKRAPISLIPQADGTYLIKDGNATAQAAMLAGWDSIPAIVEGEPAFAPNPVFTSWGDAARWAEKNLTTPSADTGLTVEGHDALSAYQQGSNDIINEYLRTGSKTYGSVVSPQVERIEQAIDAAPRTEHDLVVYRSMPFRAFKGLTAGEIYQDKGFTSTTLAREIAEGSHFEEENDVIATIEIPAGARAVYMDSIYFPYEKEVEVLLQRGSKFEITGIKFPLERGKDIEVSMRLVAQEPPPLPQR